MLADLHPLTEPQQSLQFTHHQVPTTPLLIDYTVLQLVLSHLILNAIRYAPHSGVIQVELDCQPTEPPNWLVCFQVSDHGIGIPQAEQPHVFDAYFRASNALSIPGTPGVGLGLAIVQKATQLHGGQVHLSSTFGAGTTITVSIPAIQTTP